jgi:hypothetical protein
MAGTKGLGGVSVVLAGIVSASDSDISLCESVPQVAEGTMAEDI